MKKLLLDGQLLDLTINRLCQQLIENYDQFEDAVILGLQPRGIYFAERVKTQLETLLKKQIHLGYLDPTFYRDDFRRSDKILTANQTKIDFIIEDKKVILIDDVLYTGRTIRAALDAMSAYGRPRKVELLVLVDRKYTRDLPIEPNYIGKQVNTVDTQKVLVQWKEQTNKEDKIWLVNHQE